MDYRSQFCLDKKVIVITGASSGIGRECAVAASQLGASVALLARNKDRLNETLTQMTDGCHALYQVDITMYDQLEGIVSEIADRQGKIAGFVHSAGIEGTLPLRDLSVPDYEKYFSVNLYAGLELAKIISKKKYYNKERASFVFISSVMGELGQSGKIAYCATKGALLAASRAMALELVAKNIRVNCISPGMVLTEMTQKFIENMPKQSWDHVLSMHPLGIGKPEDVSSLCIFLLSDASKWITGSNIYVDGGYSAQ